MNEEDGVWRTISGRRIFIREGQSLSEAMGESGKFAEKQISLNEVKNKDDFVLFVKQQTNVELENEKSSLNSKRKILYTRIDKSNRNAVLGLFKKYGIQYEQHLDDYFWIYFTIHN